MKFTQHLHGKTLVVLVMGLALATCSLVVWGQSGKIVHWAHNGFGMHGDFAAAMIQTHVQQVVKELDLSDRQKGEIRDIITANRDKFTADFQAIAEARSALHLQITGTTDILTAAAFAPQASALAQAVAQAAADGTNLRLHIKGVLTPEQKGKAEAMHQQMAQHFAQMHQSGIVFNAILNALK